jgi:small-conductance mechanosensitive channel
MRFTVFPAFFAFLVVAMFATAGSLSAQGLGSLLPQPEAESSNIDAIIETAAENGVGIVVIDTNGNVLNQASAEHHASSDGTTVPQFRDLQTGAVAFRTALIGQLLKLPESFAEVVAVLRNSSPDGTIWYFGEILFLSIALFVLGMLVEHYVYGRYVAKGFVVARIKEAPNGYTEKMPFLVFRFFTGLLGVFVSMVVAYVAGSIIFGPVDDQATQFTIAIIYSGYIASRLVAALWRMILSPFLPQYRIPHFADKAAKRLHMWLCVVVSTGIFAILFGAWISELGLNYEVYAFLSSLLSLGVMLLNVALVLVNRKAITAAIRIGKPHLECTWLIRSLCNIWAAAVLAYLAFAWFKLTYDLVLGNPSSTPLIVGAYGILTTIIVVYGVINFFIERGFERARRLQLMNTTTGDDAGPEDGGAIEHERVRIHTFEGLARRVAGILAFVAGVYAFVQIWQPDTMMMGDTLTERVFDIIVIIFIGYIFYNIFRIWIDAKIDEEQGEIVAGEPGDEGGVSSASRLATLLPLFRNFILIVIFVTIVLIILMEIGINVGPLFAGAGIVGVAVGFGSQSLVRDIFSGAFFLFDDAFRKGEYIDVGGVKGTVEHISVRSFQLRHHLGALHTIPFGEIQVLTNYSRDWVIMKLPLRVTYDTDVEKVRKLIKNLGVQLLDDPVIGKNFITPLKSQGVIEMQDSAMIIRVKFMTLPGDQWLVRKRAYEEIRQLFEREGIKFAHREVTVRLADGKVQDLSHEQREAAVAAAQASIEEEMLEDGGEFGDDR